MLLRVLAGENGEETEKLLLVVDGEFQQACEIVDVPEIIIALLPGKRAVLVIDDVE